MSNQNPYSIPPASRQGNVLVYEKQRPDVWMYIRTGMTGKHSIYQSTIYQSIGTVFFVESQCGQGPSIRPDSPISVSAASSVLPALPFAFFHFMPSSSRSPSSPLPLSSKISRSVRVTSSSFPDCSPSFRHASLRESVGTQERVQQGGPNDGAMTGTFDLYIIVFVASSYSLEEPGSPWKANWAVVWSTASSIEGVNVLGMLCLLALSRVVVVLLVCWRPGIC